jgi:type IV pilus assembly protein PilE
LAAAVYAPIAKTPGKRVTITLKNYQSLQRGFTLIEVLTAMLIIAILTSIALPSYVDYVRRSHRNDARSQLLQGTQYMQRFYAATDRFDRDRNSTPIEEIFPDSLRRSPSTGQILYQITVAASVTSYTLTATPISDRSMANDSCGWLQIDHTGYRTSSSNSDDCWVR